MSPSRSRNQTELDEEDYGPSRTQQRRDAKAVLAFAVQLVEMQPAKLAKIELPEDVRDEIANVRRITAHIARKRQLGFLAKVMRRHDDERVRRGPRRPGRQPRQASARKPPPCIAWNPCASG